MKRESSRRAIGLLTAGVMLAATLGLAGCGGNVHEPWVASPTQLKQERARNPAQQKALRERLTQVQTDR